MKILGYLFLLAAAGCIFAGTAPDALAATGPVSRHGRLRVVGTKIVGADGQPACLAGMSFGWSQWEAARFYNADVVNWLKQDWHCDIVRAALGIDPAGWLKDPAANEARVCAVIDAAIAADLYVIIDWHDHHAHEHPQLAVDFFQRMARRYGHRPNVIYEIFNEPRKEVTWSGDVKPYALKVIAAIRAIDPDGLIVVGSPNWSQDVDVAAADPIAGTNIAYTLHFYAGTHKQWLRDKALKAMDHGLALFVTEWGLCDADGNGPIDEASTREWFAFVRQYQLCLCNWAIADKNETSCVLKRSASSNGHWREQDLTPAGQRVRAWIRGWSEPVPAP